MHSEPLDLTPKARRTHLSLISAAETVIGRNGAHGVTVMSVCEEAGIGRTSFYNYFEDIEALTSTVATREAEQIKKRFSQLHAGVPRGAERLKACFSMILHLAIEDADKMLLLTSLVPKVPEVSKLLEAEILAELSAESELAPVDIEPLVCFLTVALLALARQMAEGAIPKGNKDQNVEYLMRACKLA